jgi:hypothetical protein
MLVTRSTLIYRVDYFYVFWGWLNLQEYSELILGFYKLVLHLTILCKTSVNHTYKELKDQFCKIKN